MVYYYNIYERITTGAQFSGGKWRTREEAISCSQGVTYQNNDLRRVLMIKVTEKKK